MIMIPREPHIIINGHELSEAQAMTVRVALTLFGMELENDQFRDDLGGMGRLYQMRQREIVALMVKETT
jgi:hypothetical protein